MSNELEAIDNGPYFEQGDNDPINGRFVNAQHKRLLVELDWMGYKGVKDPEREKQILEEEMEILKDEASKNNPLGLFYLGVCYVTGGRIPKDLVKGKAALEQALELGVERAEDFLVMHFGSAVTRSPAVSSVIESSKYSFKSDDAEDVVKRVLDEEEPGSEAFELAKAALHGNAKALLGLYNRLKGDDSDFEPAEDAFFCLYESACLKDPDALYEIGDLSICSDKYRDISYAVRCLWESSELGNEKALSSLRNLWANDLKNYEDAEYRREMNADGDDVFAVGFFYQHGICMERDLEKAKKYFSIAEKEGCFVARSALIDLDRGSETK